MHVLVVPRWQNIDRPQSLATLPLEFVKGMLDQDGDWGFTFAVPDGTTDEAWGKWYAPLIEPHGDYVEWRHAYRKVPVRLAGFCMGDRLIDLADQADVVLTNQPGGAMMLRANTETPIVGWHLWTACQQLLDLGDSRVWADEDVTVECMSALFCKINVYESEHMCQASIGTLADKVQGSRLRSLRQMSMVVNTGVTLTTPRQSEESTPIVLWGGNDTALKGRDMSLSVMATVSRYAAMRMVACSPTAWTHDDSARWPGIELISNVDAEGWRSWCSRSSIVVCNSKTESYGLAWLEAMAAGAVVVAEKAWWTESGSVFPHDWPFLAATPAEQGLMILGLIRSPSMMAEYSKKAIEYVKAHHSRSQAITDMSTALRAAVI